MGRRVLGEVKGRLADHKSLWLVRAAHTVSSRGARAILEGPPKRGGGTWHPPQLMALRGQPHAITGLQMGPQ